MRGILTLLVVGYLATPCGAQNKLYVATNGSNRNPGTRAKPFQHIQRAVSAAKPGDVICVDNGVYHESVSFPKSGDANAWITLRSLNRVDVHKGPPLVKITPKAGATAIALRGQSYIQIEGFEISGGLWGIVSSGKLGHHLVITNNLVHDTEASGIQLNNGDYCTITKNVVHDCAKKWKGSGSGISIYTPTALDHKPGFHNIIAQNICYSNSNPPGGTDGNGIIFDDSKHLQSDKKPYTPASLIENNLVYFNGGAGIQIYKSTNVTVRNNTAYWNRQLPSKFTWRGELSNQESDDVIWVNNIAWSNPAQAAHNSALLNTRGNKGVVWLNNLTYNGMPGKAGANFNGAKLPTSNLFGRDPKLVEPSSSDFRLQPGSPAIGAGTAAHGVPMFDLQGNPRKDPVDIGAYVAGAPKTAGR
jgi:parallel beta-helix repeat protein